MAIANMAARGCQQTGFGPFRRLALVAMAVGLLSLTGCIGGGGDSGNLDGPNVGFDPVGQGSTALQLTPSQLGALMSTGGNMPGIGG